ncbi:hypothetical protein [Pseudomonas sp. NMS19W]|uniref:hypothetical protein n=1 Tax=Pseudomonas sp. NMS19W TaxID=3079768 RepID=UPI003F65775F
MQDIPHRSQTLTPADSEPPTLDQSATVRALCLLALTAFLLVILAVCTTFSNTPYPTIFILAISLAILVSFYILMSLIEMRLARKLMHLKSSLLIWAVLLGGLGFFARIDAQADINGIFHVDPSLLPMTLAAASFMHALAKLEPLFYLISVLSFPIFILCCEANRKGKRTAGHAICHLSNCLVFLITGLLVSEVMAKEERRREVLYRFAHLADFNTFSPCKNVQPDEFDVLYLDSSRKRILTAPKVTTSENIEPEKYMLLKYVQVPKTFRTLECEYKVPGKS